MGESGEGRLNVDMVAPNSDASATGSGLCCCLGVLGGKASETTGPSLIDCDADVIVLDLADAGIDGDVMA